MTSDQYVFCGELEAEQRDEAHRPSISEIDCALESVLSAAGTSLRHYTMVSSLNKMRAAMRHVMVTAYMEGMGVVP